MKSTKKKDTSPLIKDASVPVQKKPFIGMSYMQILNNNYGLKKLAESERNSHTVYKTLYAFLKEVAEAKDMNELLKEYGSTRGIKNTDDISKQVVQCMKEDFPNIECNELIHLHCRRGGKGPFVLHGFVHGNTFEIVLLDPEHQLHSS